MQKRSDIETRLFDSSEFALVQDDYGQDIKGLFPEWRDAIIQADGLDELVWMSRTLKWGRENVPSKYLPK